MRLSSFSFRICQGNITREFVLERIEGSKRQITMILSLRAVLSTFDIESSKDKLYRDYFRGARGNS